jgi:hypothetical protein
MNQAVIVLYPVSHRRIVARRDSTPRTSGRSQLRPQLSWGHRPLPCKQPHDWNILINHGLMNTFAIPQRLVICPLG